MKSQSKNSPGRGVNTFFRDAQIGSQLNPEQLRAVNVLEGPLLILAGAGSGKTRVLTFRISNLIASKIAQPEEILAVTFTNRAAKSMGERSIKLLSELGIAVSTYPWISTFHSSFARILRTHQNLLGFDAPFVIYDDDEQMSVVKKVCEELGFDDKIYPPRGFQTRINEAKNLGFTPQELSQKALNFFDEKLLKVYHRYEELMFKSNALDFGDLLFKSYTLFQNHPAVLEAYRNRFQFLMVDEYQDTNHIQYRLINLMALKHRNLCVVGDEDQSIYRWRGADITNILNFKQDYPEAQTVKLEQNYRSTQNIVRAASELIKNNTQRNEKNLFSENEIGDPIHIQELASEQNEAQFVSRTIKAIIESAEFTYKDIAIFYRTNAQSRVLEDHLRMNAIPYRIIGAVNFYDRAEVKDLVSYLKVLVNPKDDLAALRIINRPARRIGKSSIEKIESVAQLQSCSILEAIDIVVKDKIVNPSATRGLEAFSSLLINLRSGMRELTPLEVYENLLEQSGYLKSLESEKTVEAQNRIENLLELKSAIYQYQKEQGEGSRIPEFLEEMALITDRNKDSESDDKVTMMTLHLSKGLEFSAVFLVGLEEGLFPSRQSFDSLDPTALEEERRLCYVGMTRAEKKLFISYARQRFIRGIQEYFPPSRFINEIPQEFVRKQSVLATPRFMSAGGAPSYAASFRENIFPDYESAPPNSDQEYSKGVRVRHPIFGLGVVHQLEGDGDNQKVTVLFNNNTLKKFALRFARLERI